MVSTVDLLRHNNSWMITFNQYYSVHWQVFPLYGQGDLSERKHLLWRQSMLDALLDEIFWLDWEAIVSVLSYVKRWEMIEELTSLITKSRQNVLASACFFSKLLAVVLSTHSGRYGDGCCSCEVLPSMGDTDLFCCCSQRSQAHVFGFLSVPQLNTCLIIFGDLRKGVSSQNTLPNLHGWLISKSRAMDSDLPWLWGYHSGQCPWAVDIYSCRGNTELESVALFTSWQGKIKQHCKLSQKKYM